MAEVASAYVSLLPSLAGFGRSLDRQVTPQLEAAGKKGGSRFAGGLKAAIGPALAFLGTAAVASFLKGSVDQASDLNETLSKSSVIFGKQAGAIEAFGNSAAKSLGLSKEQAIASAAGFGDMFTQIGFTGKEAAKFSQSVVKMSADLGSFNNLETSDVTDRMSAAFRGEYDSLQAVIPNINAARVESEALATTGKKTAKELTAQEKATAVLAIVSKDGARAQGDFARTSGGLANQQKILSAQTADLRAKIGTALLPALTKAATYVNSTVIPAVSKFVTGMRDGTGAGGKLVSTLEDVYTRAQPAISAITSVVSAFGGMPSATQKVILLAGAVLLLQNRFAGSLPSIQNFDRTAALATAKTVAMRGGALAAGGALAGLAQQAGGASTTLGSLATVGASMATGFAVAGPWGAAIGGAASVLALFAGKSRSAAAAQDRLDLAGKRVAATLNQQTGAITANTRAVAAKELADEGAFSAANKMGIPLRDVLNASLGNEGAIKRVSAATEAWSTRLIKSGDYTEKQEAHLRTLTKAVSEASGSIAEQRVKIAQTNEALGKSASASKQAGKAIRDMGKDAGKSGSIMSAAGSQAGSGFYNGLHGWLGEIAAVGAQIGQTVAKAARDKLKIESPSRVMYDIGSFAGEGLALGVASREADVRRSGARSGNAIATGVRSALRNGDKGLDAYLKTVNKKIADSLSLKRTRPGMSKKQRAAVADYNDAARKAIKAQKAAVDQFEKSLSRLVRRIDAAKAKLQDLKDARTQMADQTSSSIRGELDLTQANGKKLSFATVAANVSGLASRAKAFAGKLRALLKAGIPAGLVQEVAGYGTVEGSKVADALLSGSKQQIGQLAKDYAGVGAYSKQIGDIVAGSMYDAGIKAQEGILKGLLDDKAIQRSADRLAKKLTKAVKKSLGIKSPSRVFQNEVGKYIPAGIVAGIDDGQRALDRRVRGMVNVSQIGKVAPGDFAGGMGSGSNSLTPDSMPIVDGSQIIGYLRGVASGQARIEIAAAQDSQQIDFRMATA